MEQPEAREAGALCAQQSTVDQSLGFLLLIVVSLLYSVWSVFIQRKGLCLALCGDEAGAAALPPVFSLKWRAGAIVVGSLGFFLCLALEGLGTAQAGEDCVAKKSAGTNALAALLVFLAAVLRLDDLRFTEACRPALTREDTLPD